MENNSVCYKLRCNKCDFSLESLDLQDIVDFCPKCNSILDIVSDFSFNFVPTSEILNRIYKNYLNKKPHQQKLDTFKLAICDRCKLQKFRNKNKEKCPNCNQQLRFTDKDINFNFDIMLNVWTNTRNTLNEMCLQKNDFNAEELYYQKRCLYKRINETEIKNLNDKIKEKPKQKKRPKTLNLADIVEDLLNKNDPEIEEIDDDTDSTSCIDY